MIRHVTFGVSSPDEVLFHNALDRPTDRSSRRKFDHYRPLCYDSNAA